LQSIQKQAIAKREEFLQSLQDTAKETNNQTRKKLIKQLQMAEMNQRCFATIKAIMKPRSPRGLNHLLVCHPTEAN